MQFFFVPVVSIDLTVCTQFCLLQRRCSLDRCCISSKFIDPAPSAGRLLDVYLDIPGQFHMERSLRIFPSSVFEDTAGHCISDVPFQWKKGNFDPLQLPHFYSDLSETKNEETHPGYEPACKI